MFGLKCRRRTASAASLSVRRLVPTFTALLLVLPFQAAARAEEERQSTPMNDRTGVYHEDDASTPQVSLVPEVTHAPGSYSGADHSENPHSEASSTETINASSAGSESPQEAVREPRTEKNDHAVDLEPVTEENPDRQST